MYFLSASLAGWLQLQLELMGKPTFDDRGGVVKTGNDLGQSGLTEYMFDILYLTWGIQLLVAFTTAYAWWLYLLVHPRFIKAELDTRICCSKSVGFAQRSSKCASPGSTGEAEAATEKRSKTINNRILNKNLI
jgi:SRP-independent targeting protein 2/TMEM208